MADTWRDLMQFEGQPGYVTVWGPPWTGPRKTIVRLSDPMSWPRWIAQDDATGQPVDDGTVTGGTWQGGAQSLPDVVTTAQRIFDEAGQKPDWWLLAAIGVSLLVLANRGRRG
jgi:hypothetical protein